MSAAEFISNLWDSLISHFNSSDCVSRFYLSPKQHSINSACLCVSYSCGCISFCQSI
eukprot:gnl/Chilomastix_caulleri/5216.p1 GENE.gnl/Chilomastix_caulleri/5216~~gnl/Chilomastix_caulleri/5216.p1  ORF type:complete len:57 (+),score=4.88 gnl/Chilomastix_caulleri/5216:130-300(+)